MKNEYRKLVIGYLQGTLTKDECDLFYKWVEESPTHKKFYFELKAIYDLSLSLNKPNDIERSWKRLLDKKEPRRIPKHPHFRIFVNYVAVALITIAVSSIFFFTFLPDNQEGLSTRYIGGDGLDADIVELPDGTRVSLGSKTNFHYANDYGKISRTVYLEGEAYFDVAKQKNKPFIVKTKEQDIEALGTKFNVMAYAMDSLVITTLLEGSVKLSSLNKSQNIFLKPDQQFIYNRNSKKTSLQQVDAQQYVSWTTGYYYFREQSLQKILDRLSHVYGVTFDVKSTELYNRMFTGTFYRGQSIKDIMEIVNLSIPIKYEIDDHHVVIL